MEIRLVDDLGEPWRSPEWTDARFFGGFETTLPHGVYAVLAREGDLEMTRVILLTEDQEEELAPLAIDAAFPLVNTRHYSAAHAATLEAASGSAPHPAPGGKAEILICLRATDAPENWRIPPLLLREAGDAAGVTLGEDGLPGHVTTGCISQLFAVRPGPQLVEMELEGQKLRLALHAVEGWRTTLCVRFGTEAAAEEHDVVARSIGLRRGALAITRPSYPFRPDDEALRWTEAALHALGARRRWPIREQRRLIEGLCRSSDGGADNPFLAVLAGHLLLVRGSVQAARRSDAHHGVWEGETAFVGLTPDEQAELIETVDWIVTQLGPLHPDCLALASVLPKRTQLPPVLSPPVLRASANLLVKANAVERVQLAPETWAAIQRGLQLQPFLVSDGSRRVEEWRQTLADVIRASNAEVGGINLAAMAASIASRFPSAETTHRAASVAASFTGKLAEALPGRMGDLAGRANRALGTAARMAADYVTPPTRVDHSIFDESAVASGKDQPTAHSDFADKIQKITGVPRGIVRQVLQQTGSSERLE